MRLFLFISTLVFPALLSAQAEDCHCLKPQIEIGLGAQLSSAIITEVEIPDSPELKKGPGGLAYSFHLSIRTHPAKFQAGLDLIQDMINLKFYYPVYFPDDWPDHVGDSKWNVFYKSYRIGIGMHMRFNFNKAFTQLGVAYLNSVSEKVTDQITSWDGEFPEHENGYTAGNSGVTLNALFGTHFGDGKWKRFSWHAGITYDTNLNLFDHDLFEGTWSYHNLAYTANINYQLNKIE